MNFKDMDIFQTQDGIMLLLNTIEQTTENERAEQGDAFEYKCLSDKKEVIYITKRYLERNNLIKFIKTKNYA